jgi:hypothetical protein
MKRFLLWAAGAAAVFWVASQIRQAGTRIAQRKAALDLNHCSRDALLRVPGLTEVLVDRIIENRPYRHRLDLVARMVVPSGIYQNIRERVDVDGNTAGRAVKVA